MKIYNKKTNNIAIAGIICALALYNFPIKSFSQTNNNRNAMDTKVNTLDTRIKMQCEVKGEGDPILLVGGGLTGWKSWEPFVEIFNSKQRKVIRVQLLAVKYGLENRPLPVNYSVKTESSALAATLDSMGLTIPMDIVAWSFGAFTSLDYALDHPERIRTLTLIEPPAIWVLRETGKFDEEAEQNAKFFQNFHGNITEDMLADFLVHAGFVAPGKSPRDLPQWNGWVPFRQSLRCNPYVVSYIDNVERLKKFQPPVLLVKGTGSTDWLHHIIDGLSENIPHSRVVEFPGGHAPHIVSRDKFLSELEKFEKELK
jgi:pimeloyl-ACP methyl ester carboxylesterase